MRSLHPLAEQADLQYLLASAGRIFNSPEATGMGFWSVNPYVGCAFGCAYCYARDTHRWALERAGDAGLRAAASMPSWLAFERRILVKQHAAAGIREALRSSRAPRPGDTVVIGSATDPYQPAERRFLITQQLLHALTAARDFSITIITKSPLVTRDIPVLRTLAERHRVQVHISLITVDRALARRLEPRAPTPAARLRAVRRLADAGVDVSVNCMPVLPGITDSTEMLEALVAQVAAAGAQSAGAAALRLRSTARRRYLPVIREGFPELADRYEATYGNSVHAGERYREGLQQVFTTLCERHGLRTRSYRTADDVEPEEPTSAKTREQFQLL